MLLATIPVVADGTPDDSRPRVGLVLGGGGARGAAHVSWLHRLGGSDLPFASKTDFGVWADAGNVWDDSRDVRLGDLIDHAALTIFIETPLGPRHFGYGRADDGTDAFHLDFGVHPATAANSIPRAVVPPPVNPSARSAARPGR